MAPLLVRRAVSELALAFLMAPLTMVTVPLFVAMFLLSCRVPPSATSVPLCSVVPTRLVTSTVVVPRRARRVPSLVSGMLSARVLPARGSSRSKRPALAFCTVLVVTPVKL